MATAKPRRTGATAVIAPNGPATITSATGGKIALNRGASDTAFSPLDLLYAAIAGCLVVSARTAASRRGVLDHLTEVRVHVGGEKAPDRPARVTRLLVRFTISGDFDAAMRAALVADAEEMCTVSNTIRGKAEFVTMIEGTGAGE